MGLLNINLYMYEVFKSKYLEDNKDREITQDELNSKLDNIKLLYLFNSDLPKGKYLDFIKDHGTEVNVCGYGYNLDRIADVLNKINGTDNLINARDLVLTNNEVNGNLKELSVYNVRTDRNYKLSINENNKVVIIPKNFKAYGVNMLIVDEVENIELSDSIMIDMINDAMRNNGGYITDRNKLYILKDLIGKDFIRKWDRENIIVSVYINNIDCDYGYDYMDEFFGDEDEF